MASEAPGHSLMGFSIGFEGCASEKWLLAVILVQILEIGGHSHKTIKICPFAKGYVPN